MAEALLWGLLGASSLVIGTLLVFVRRPSHRVLGMVMGFGAGALVSAVSFELVEEAIDVSEGGTALGFFTGALVFLGGDALLARIGGGRGDASRPSSGASTAGLTVVLGSVLDGIPESAVLGLGILESGTVSVAVLAAVFISNLPESVAGSDDLLTSGSSKRVVLALWVAITIISGVASAAGYVLLDEASPRVLAFTLAFAGGAILAMLSTSMIPEAFEKAGRIVGLFVTLGFASAYAIHFLTSE